MKKIMLIFTLVIMNCTFSKAQEGLTSPYLDSYITERMEIAHIAGVSACIIKNDEIRWIGNYGFANIEQGVPVDTTTLFYMASVSKTVVCTALMQLWEEGLFDLDDDINEYLPFEVHNPYYQTIPITFRMLCTHTSCIKDNALVNPYYWGEDSPIPLGQFLFDYLNPAGVNYFPDLNFFNLEPGTVYNYSNVAASLAGYLVEVIGDSTFSYQTKERIFDPLQMNESAWFLSEVDTTNLAMPYYWNGSELLPYGYYALSTYPAGALRTSVDQLAKFLMSYMNSGNYPGGQILQSSTIDTILSDQIPAIDIKQGLFWNKLYLGDRVLWGHEGSNLGARTTMRFSPDENTGVILIANTVHGFSNQIVDLLFDYASDSIPCSCLPNGITFTTQAQIDNFQTNYPGCTEIEGDVTIQGYGITNLNGLNDLTSIMGKLIIGFPYYANWNLTSIAGLNNLTNVGGSFKIQNNFALTSLAGLENLTYIGGDLRFSGNVALISLVELENLTSIGGDLYIQSNNALTSLSGLESLTSVGGGLIINSNNALTSLSALERLPAIEGIIWISHNPLLSNCNLQFLCNYLLNPSGSINIYNNAPGCNNPPELAANCGFTMPCMPFGNYYFINQVEIDSFQSNYLGCSQIEGDVTINDGNTGSISNLNGLSVLTSVGGDIKINENYALTSLTGLEGLTSIGGGLYLYDNYSLTSLTGLEGLTSIGGELYLYDNYSLTSLTGLENLTSVGGHLSIADNLALTSLSGLNNLTYIGSYLGIYNNHALTSLSGLNNLTSIGWDLVISGNNVLASLSGMDNLTSIPGNLYIRDNHVLTNLSGLENLNSIGGELRIGGYPSYYGNPVLTSLEGIDNIAAGSITDLTISYNPQLSTCEVLNICDYLAAPNGTITISNNAPGCNSQAQVVTACEGLGIGEEPTGDNRNWNVSIFPNPGSGIITIEFEMREVAYVTVAIFNLTGQQVAEPVYELKNPGQQIGLKRSRPT